MRIALVSQEYPPETAKGGLGTQTHIKAHGLAALGHQVHVISRSVTRQKIVRQDGDVTVTRIPGADARFGIHTSIADWITYATEVASAIEEIHRQTALALVDVPEWAAEGSVHLLNRTEWNAIPTVVQLHGPLIMFARTMGWPEIDSEFFRVGTALEGATLRLADGIYASSGCSADWCAREYGLDRTRIPVLHTGIDTALFSPRAVPPAKRPTIVFAGKLVRNKGVPLLVEACGRLARDFPDLQLRVLGKGEPRITAELRAAAARFSSNDFLDMPGFVPREELPEHFSRAHLFAAPSQYEGGPGFVYLEAMACGLPVVACAGSGAAEVVRDGGNGLLVPPQDVEALTAALRRLLSEPEWRTALGAQAREFVLGEADSRICLKKIEAFYQTIVHPRA
jgi:glycosyltransferase involved in cell wall biosynthesis